MLIYLIWSLSMLEELRQVKTDDPKIVGNIIILLIVL